MTTFKCRPMRVGGTLPRARLSAFLACVATMLFSTTSPSSSAIALPKDWASFAFSERDAPVERVSHRLSSSVRSLFEIIRAHNGQ
jgi:hypothetical protein